LEIAGLAVGDQIADTLRRLTALGHIDVSSTRVGDQTAAAVAALTGVEVATFANTDLTDTGVMRLAASQATELDVRGRPVSTGVVERLADSPRLRKLSLSVGDDWTGLARLGREVVMDAAPRRAGSAPALLTTLDLAGDLSTDLADELAQLPALESLRVHGSMPDSIPAQGFASLKELQAENAGLTDDALAAVLKAPTLEAVFISGNPVGEAFAGAPGNYLHTLELRRTRVDDHAIERIATLPRLHCLDVPATQVTPDGIAALAATAPNLQSLAIDAGQVDAVSVQALATAPRLLEIYLYGPEVNLETLQALTPVHIRDLQLIDTLVSDAAVPVLAAMPRLRSLSLSAGGLTDPALRRLRALRPDITVRRYAAASQTTTRRGSPLDPLR
jgi:hypothetical protein